MNKLKPLEWREKESFIGNGNNRTTGMFPQNPGK